MQSPGEWDSKCFLLHVVPHSPLFYFLLTMWHKTHPLFSFLPFPSQFTVPKVQRECSRACVWVGAAGYRCTCIEPDWLLDGLWTLHPPGPMCICITSPAVFSSDHTRRERKINLAWSQPILTPGWAWELWGQDTLLRALVTTPCSLKWAQEKGVLGERSGCSSCRPA